MLRAVSSRSELAAWPAELLDDMSALRGAVAELDRLTKFPPSRDKAARAAELAVRIASLSLGLRPDALATAANPKVTP